MGKYYYVTMVNKTSYYDDKKGIVDTATGAEIKNIAVNTELNSSHYAPSVLSLLGIKSKQETRIIKGFLGIQRYETYYIDVPVFVICEDSNGYLEEVVTGNRYEPVTSNRDKVYSNKLKLYKAQEIPSKKVAEILRSLSEDEIASYASKIHELDKAIAKGYQKDIQIQEDEDSYIKSFRKKYGK